MKNRTALNKYAKLIASILLATCVLNANAELSLPAIISDNMVLQQQSEAKLWGNASPCDTIAITTSWNKHRTTAIADASGKWSAKISTPKCRQGATITFSTDTKSITVGNILIGEVWLCSGQSNMEFSVGKQGDWCTGMSTFDKEMADADYPMVHLFQVDKTLSVDTPRTDCSGHWVVCKADNIFYFSAIAFVVGRELFQHLHRPIGIIDCSWGGSHAESWTKRDIMTSDSLYTPVLERFSAENMAPKQWLHKVPGALWNSMVYPILGYTVKGNIWYQGESNAFRAEDYPRVFSNMINSWREEWQQRLPFYCMMAAPHSTQPPQLRMAQIDTWLNCGISDIGMATVIDRGDSLDLHPRDKLTAGKRLAAWALAKEYSQKVPYMGPLLKSYKIDNDKIIIKFRYAKGLHIVGNKLNDMEIAGSDGVFHPAEAEIKGSTIIVSSPKVAAPVSARYCQSPYCIGNLYNSDNLPAYPFTTGDWHIKPQ